MENLEKLAKELAGMDKQSREQMLSRLTANKELMAQVSEAMKNAEFRKKLKELLK